MAVAIEGRESRVDAVRCPQEEAGLCPLSGPATDSERPKKSSGRGLLAAQKPIVILQHRAGCAPSSVTGFLNDGDRPWEVRRLWLGEPVPERPDDTSAVIMLGGPMNVHEEADHSFLVAEKAFLRAALAVNLPMLGICLGAQLLAEVGGGRVYRRDKEEIGLVHIDLVADDPLFAGVESPFMAFESHSYSFTLPPAATPLAGRPDGLQAFRLGKAWGLQFHPEVDADRARQWVEEQLSCNREGAPLDSEVAAAVRAKTAALLPLYQQLCRRLIGNWLELSAKNAPGA
jgi:GMP synthase (glutamine-hydrolysing)